MPALLYVAKAVTPEQLSWRQRITRNEKGLLALFRDWVARLRGEIGDAQLVQAVVTGAAGALDHLLQAVAFQPTAALEEIAAAEAVREFDEVLRTLDAGLRLSFNVRDPNFQRAVDEQGARLIREVTDETRRAVNNLIARAYREGQHPYTAAPAIRELVGLTSRQAQAVWTYRNTLETRGVAPAVAQQRADRYAARMLTRRAQTIGRTETARAQVTGRLASYEQAAARGLLDAQTTMLEWSSVQTDPNEICYQLDGKRVPLGDTFDGVLPPAHPNCRCSVHAVTERSDDLAARLQARIPELNRLYGIPS